MATKTKRTTTARKPAPAKPEHGARKNAARKIFRARGMDRGTFIDRVVKVGATAGTARVWWQQFRSGASPVKVA